MTTYYRVAITQEHHAEVNLLHQYKLISDFGEYPTDDRKNRTELRLVDKARRV